MYNLRVNSGKKPFLYPSLNQKTKKYKVFHYYMFLCFIYPTLKTSNILNFLKIFLLLKPSVVRTELPKMSKKNTCTKVFFFAHFMTIFQNPPEATGGWGLCICAPIVAYQILKNLCLNCSCVHSSHTPIALDAEYIICS